MASVSSVEIRKPADWQDFERAMVVLAQCELKDPHAQPYGRGGQNQQGIDILARRGGDPTKLVGIQCKHYPQGISEQQLEAEIDKATLFTPRLTEFVVATTGPRDARLQRRAAELAEGLATAGTPIAITIWSWDDVVAKASKHPEAYNAFDPTFDPFSERAFITLHQGLADIRAQMESSYFRGGSPATSRTDETDIQVESDEVTPLHGQITAYQSLIETGQAEAALAQLEKLHTENWSSASLSERYRLLVATASAKLRLGQPVEASQLIFQASREHPDHPKAALNEAKGWLLAQDYAKAHTQALSALKAAPDNAEAAAVLIQALNGDESIEDPLADVPVALRDSAEVLTALTLYYRSIRDPRWCDIAAEAAKQHRHDATLHHLAAEASLIGIITMNPDLSLGAPASEHTRRSLERCAADLAEHAERLRTTHPARLPLVAHNAALALRLVGQDERAKEILDAALAEHPEDDDLRIQRAAIAHSDGDTMTVLSLIPNDPTDDEARVMRAEALVATEESEAALRSLEMVDTASCEDHVRRAAVAIRINAYQQLGEVDQAQEHVGRIVRLAPDDLGLRAIQIGVEFEVNGEDAAVPLLEQTINKVGEDAPLADRMALAAQAERIQRHDLVVSLLDNRVATDAHSPALRMLFAATINGRYLRTAKRLIDRLSNDLKQHPDIIRAEAIVALNAGDPTAEQSVGRYLTTVPNDLPMLLARLRLWASQRRDGDIRRELADLDTSLLRGDPEDFMLLARFLAGYVDTKAGFELGYRTLLTNWGNPQVHLGYHGLLLLNEDSAEGVIPSTDTVGTDTVVGVAPEGGAETRRYRIESDISDHFANERIVADDDLATLLLGKRVGDQFTAQNRIGSQVLVIKWIKHVWLDALHESMNQFNTRFPRAEGMSRFEIDFQGEDPLHEMKEMTRAQSQAAERALDFYSSHGIPLAYLASLLGKDPVEAYWGLPAVNRRFLACRGNAAEREEAMTMLRDHGAAGCVVDSITLAVLRHLELADVVEAVCGPIHTTQSVLDLFDTREAESSTERGKKRAVAGWQDGQFVIQEYSDEMVEQEHLERKDENRWVREQCRVVSAIPQEDPPLEVRQIIDLFDRHVADPAIAAQGSNMILLSEDMGYRLWALSSLGVAASWIQPVLMVGRASGTLDQARYSDAVTRLALLGHRYLSLSSGDLFHQVRKDDFEPSRALEELLLLIGGPSADMRTNTRVVSEFIHKLTIGDNDERRVRQITSLALSCMTEHRIREQRSIVAQIMRQLPKNDVITPLYALDWLIGHSLGLPELGALIELRKTAH